MKYKTFSFKSNFVNHVLERNHNIRFDIEIDLMIIIKQHNFYLNSVFDDIIIYNNV